MVTRSQSEIIRKNAQALELYLRTSPAVASFFLQHFQADPDDPALLKMDLTHYDPLSSDIALAQMCDNHLSYLFEFTRGQDVRMDRDVAVPPETDDRERLALNFRIDLSDPRLRDLILIFAAETINVGRSQSPEYSLCCFPSGKDVETYEQMADYQGIRDSQTLQAKLGQLLTADVTAADLEGWVGEMTHLTGVLGQGRSGGGALPGL